MEKRPEPWLRGIKTAGLSPLFQPIVDAWIGAKEDIDKYLTGFSESKLWEQPFGLASVGFHLEHMAGVIDRLLSYAESKPLTQEQFSYLKAEGTPKPGVTIKALITQLENRMAEGTKRLIALSMQDPASERMVGRQGLPSTLIGLCVHSAEHTTRHTGQLIVTATLLKG